MAGELNIREMLNKFPYFYVLLVLSFFVIFLACSCWSWNILRKRMILLPPSKSSNASYDSYFSSSKICSQEVEHSIHSSYVTVYKNSGEYQRFIICQKHL